MAYQLKHNGNDISDYVVSDIQVPWHERNRTFEGVAGIFSFSVSRAYTTPIAIGDVITFQKDSLYYYSGLVEDNDEEYSSEVFHIKAVSRIKQIEQKLLKESNIQTTIQTGTSAQYALNDNNGTNVYMVQLLWLLKCIVDEGTNKEVTLDTSAVEEVDWLAWPPSWDAKYKEIYINEAMLYLLGQTDISNPNDNERLNFFELLNLLCGIFSFTIVPTDATTFKLYGIDKVEDYSLADEDVYNVTVSKTYARIPSGYYAKVTWDTYTSGGSFDIIRPFYLGAPYAGVEDYASWGDEEARITFPRNLAFFIQNRSEAAGICHMGYLSGGLWFSQPIRMQWYRTGGYSYIAGNFIKDEILDWNKQTIEAKLQTTFKAVAEHSIVVSRNKECSRIVEETAV